MTTPRSPSASGVLRTMAAAASRIMLNVPIRFTRTVFSNEASGCGPSLPTVLAATAIPAQLTSPASRPSFSAASTAAWPSVSDATSHFTNWPPSSSASAVPAASFRSAMTTLPPACASIRAVPAPSPDAPPVTMNTLFWMSIRLSPWFAVVRLPFTLT
ncbi:hypothetical protein D3C86_1473610 [compost metagenome]